MEPGALGSKRKPDRADTADSNDWRTRRDVGIQAPNRNSLTTTVRLQRGPIRMIRLGDNSHIIHIGCTAVTHGLNADLFQR